MRCRTANSSARKSYLTLVSLTDPRSATSAKQEGRGVLVYVSLGAKRDTSQTPSSCVLRCRAEKLRILTNMAILRFVLENHVHHDMLPDTIISHQRVQRRHGQHTRTQTARELVRQIKFDGLLYKNKSTAVSVQVVKTDSILTERH